MKLILHGKEVDLNDPIDMHFLNQYAMWIKYSYSPKSIDERKRKGSYSKLLLDYIDKGYWDYNETNPKHFKTNESGTIGISDKGSDILLIFLGSMPGHEERLGYPIVSVPSHIDNTNVDILCAREYPTLAPDYLYPCCYYLGVDRNIDTFEKMCDYFRTIITKDYKKVIVFGDSRHSAVALAVSHYLQDIVTNCFIVHGQNTHSFDDSPWVSNFIKYPNGENCPHPMPFPAVTHVTKCFELKKRGIAHEYLSPLDYLNKYPNIQVDYYYGKYDNEHQQFLDYAFDRDAENINFHEVDYLVGSGPTHHIRPIIDRKLLPEYIERLKDA